VTSHNQRESCRLPDSPITLSQEGNPMSRRIRNRAGVVAVAFAISLVVILGFAGMAIDIGRLMLIKGEVQDYCDAAALAAAQALEGVGFAAADAAATAEWKRWDMQNESFTTKATIVVQYSNSPDSGWKTSAEGPDPAHARFARVQATVQPAVYLLPVITGSGAGTVTAAAVAGQVKLTRMGAGLFPFAPIAPNSNPSQDFGFEPGMTYAFRWSSKADGALAKYIKDPKPSTLKALQDEFCDGDLYYASGAMKPLADLQAAVNASKDRGFYVDPDEGGSASYYRSLVLNGETGNRTWGGGDLLTFKPSAVQSVLDAMKDRIQRDKYPLAWRYNSSGPSHLPDPLATAPNYYKTVNDSSPGNFLRVVYVPITNRATGAVLEFRSFLLGPVDFYFKSGNEKWCAEYIGPRRVDGRTPVERDGIYTIRLVR